MAQQPLGRWLVFGYLFFILTFLVISGPACTTHEPSLVREVDSSRDPNPETAIETESLLSDDSSDFLAANNIELPETRIFAGNLRYFVPPDWNQPLVVSSLPHSSSGENSTFIKDPYISWAIVRDGEFLVTTQFFVDLYLDKIFLERWEVDTLNPGVPKIMADWNEMLYRTNLSSGEHQLKLVLDSTDLILEDDETDNIYFTTFTLLRDPSTEIERTIALERLPNLNPFTPPGWQSPIRVVNSQGVSNGFLIGETQKVQVAFRNSGLSSIDRNFLVYLYLDEIPVAKFSERNLIADEAIVTAEWSGLNRILRITPGEHTFKLVVDPTHLIRETLETDNTFLATFSWGQNAESNDQQGSVSPQTKVGSIEPLVPPGWDSPLIITSVPGNFSSSDSLNYLEPAFVHWAVINRGDFTYERPYDIELRLDGLNIKSWHRTRLGPNETDIIFDWVLVPPLDVSPTSTVELLGRFVDDSEHFREVLFAKSSIRWTANYQNIDNRTSQFSKLVLAKQLFPLESLLSTNEPLVSTFGLDNAKKLLDLTDAIYYEIYSKSLTEEKLKIHLLSQEEYFMWISIECRDRGGFLPEEVREKYIEDCHRIDEFGGFFTYWRNHFHIVVQAERPPMEVLETLAHELGHFRQSVTNPQLSSVAQSLDILAFREAQAYIHQVLFIRTLGQLVGRDLLSYPKLDGYEWFVDRGVEQLINGADSNEHDRGRLLLWLSVLTDPKLATARNVLLSNNYLTPVAAKEVFLYFLSFRPTMISSYIASHMETKQTYESAIMETGKSRLSFEVAYWNEGSPYLRETGLLLP